MVNELLKPKLHSNIKIIQIAVGKKKALIVSWPSQATLRFRECSSKPDEFDHNQVFELKIVNLTASGEGAG